MDNALFEQEETCCKLSSAVDFVPAQSADGPESYPLSSTATRYHLEAVFRKDPAVPYKISLLSHAGSRVARNLLATHLHIL